MQWDSSAVVCELQNKGHKMYAVQIYFPIDAHIITMYFCYGSFFFNFLPFVCFQQRSEVFDVNEVKYRECHLILTFCDGKVIIMDLVNS